MTCTMSYCKRMARDLEAARAAGLADAYSADEAVGIAVNQLMFEKRITRKRLGEALGVSGPNAGRKLRGEVAWSIEDVLRTAALLGVDAARLMPRRSVGAGIEDPAAFEPAVGRAGLEPATQGL